MSASLKALSVIAIAAGATCTSHVNDSGFWLVSRYLGLSVTETLKTWTVMTTVVGLVGLGMVLCSASGSPELGQAHCHGFLASSWRSRLSKNRRASLSS